MGESPSNRRKKGRDAFVNGCDPMDIQPYKLGTWAYTAHLQDWLDGWNEAEEQYDAESAEELIEEFCSECGQVLPA